MIAVAFEHFCSRQTSKHIQIVKKQRFAERTTDAHGYGHRSFVPPEFGGARRDRTADLLLAKQALSQLSYGPVGFPRNAP